MVRRTAAILIFSLSPAWSAAWIRLASPHFEIYTDAAERSARRVLTRFEQARQILSTSTEWREPAGIHTRVLLFSSEREFAAIRPAAPVTGFYQSGPDRDYIAILAGAEVDRIVLHEYTHAVLNHAAIPLPPWLEEGLAELYSTLSVTGNRASIGGPIVSHVVTLSRETWRTGSELAAVGKEAPEYNEASKAGIFYSQSWALTHMLTFGRKYRGHLAEFIDRLATDETPAAAFADAFGISIDGAVLELASYVRAGFAGVEIDAPEAGQILFSGVTELDPAIAIQSRAEILLLMGRDEAARRTYEDAARRYTKSPAALTGLAVLAMRERNFGEARRLFERAISLGAQDGSTYFEYAMLLRDTGAPAAQVTEHLEKAVAANPAHAEARFLLGVRASDAGRFSDAVSHLRTATEILPRQAYFWQALSFAYHRLGRPADARSAALRALRAAKSDHENAMARSMLALIDQPESAARTGRPDVIVPDSWKPPKGDSSVSGQLVQVDCNGSSATIRVRTGSGILRLAITDPRKVDIRGGPSRSLACGVQANPVNVQVEFITGTNEVTALTFL